MTKIIALDLDGVVLDYKTAYAGKWTRAFGQAPKMKNPEGHQVWEYWDIPFLNPVELAELEKYADEEFWSAMPLLPRVGEACNLMIGAGYELIAVTAAPEHSQEFRFKNLKAHTLPISEVICTSKAGISPKTDVINRIQPAFFVDDFINYFHGIVGPKKVLVNSPINNPSEHVKMEEMDFVVKSLYQFASENL